MKTHSLTLFACAGRCWIFLLRGMAQHWADSAEGHPALRMTGSDVGRQRPELAGRPEGKERSCVLIPTDAPLGSSNRMAWMPLDPLPPSGRRPGRVAPPAGQALELMAPLPLGWTIHTFCEKVLSPKQGTSTKISQTQ